MMKYDLDSFTINMELEFFSYEELSCIEKSLSKIDNEYTDTKYPLSFDNSFQFNPNLSNIKEDITDNNTDKRYFIVNKINKDIKKNITFSLTLNKDINDKILEIKLIEKKMTRIESIITHNKYTFDNILRKMKNLGLNSCLIFINKKIEDVYKYSEEKSNWKLYVMDHTNAFNSNILYNRNFFNKTLKEIFSDDVSTKCKTIEIIHNKNIIQKLLNEEDEEKRQYFEKILNYKFIDVIKYLRGEIEGLEEFEGLEIYDISWNKIQEDENFLKYFIINMSIIEILLLIKKPRNRKKRKMDDKINFIHYL